MMSSNATWLFTLSSILHAFVLIAALIFVMVQWFRYPKPSLFAFLGFGLHLASMLSFNLIRYLFQQSAGPSSSYYILTLGGLSIAQTLIGGVATFLLLVAVYIARNPTQNATHVESRPQSGTSITDNPYSS